MMGLKDGSDIQKNEYHGPCGKICLFMHVDLFGCVGFWLGAGRPCLTKII